MKLFHRQYGSGPPLVILHGLFGSSDNWTSIAKQVAGTYTVILPDQRNHGNSPHSPIHDYDSMRDDLHELAESLSLDKFFLAGHSMGGKTAIAYALKWPEMLNGLLIADISPFRGAGSGGAEYTQHAAILKAMLSLDLSSITSRQEAEAALEASGLSSRITGFILKNLNRKGDKHFEWKINVPVLLENLNRIMEPVERQNAFYYQVTGFPVIFLKGKESDYLPSEDYPDIRKIFPAAEFMEVENAGHWIHADNPGAVVENMKKMLNGI